MVLVSVVACWKRFYTSRGKKNCQILMISKCCLHSVIMPKHSLHFSSTECYRFNINLSHKFSPNPNSPYFSPSPRLLHPTISLPPLPSFPTLPLSLSFQHASRPLLPSSTTCGSSSSHLTPHPSLPWLRLPIFWKLACTSASVHISNHTLRPSSTC